MSTTTANWGSEVMIVHCNSLFDAIFAPITKNVFGFDKVYEYENFFLVGTGRIILNLIFVVIEEIFAK